MERKMLVVHDLYCLTENDLVDYTILCLGNKGVFEFCVDDLIKAIYEINSKYNEKRYNCVFGVYIDKNQQLIGTDIINYLQFSENCRKEFIRILKSKDYSRFDQQKTCNSKKIKKEILGCGFALYNSRTGKVKSVFGRLFKPETGEKLYSEINSEIIDIFEEVADRIIDLQSERENEKKGEGKEC